MQAMTSKQRVLMTINHQEPDRVPVGEWGIDHDHVSRIIGHPTYWRNRKQTTLALWDNRRDEVVEGLKNDCVELVEKLDYDVVTVGYVPSKGYYCEDPPRQVAPDEWRDSRGNVYRYSASNDSIQCITPQPGREAVSDDEILAMMQSAADVDESAFELLDFIGDRFGEERAVLFNCIDIFHVLMGPFGGDYNHQLILTAIAPDQIKKLYQYGLERNRRVIEHCAGHHVSVAMQGYDFCMNTGCIFNPAVIRDIFFPFMGAVNREIESSGMIPFFHCCGNTWEIMEDFIGAGYRGYQSIQKSAQMDWMKLKQRYGDKLTLWTGVQCETLIEGAMQDVADEVTRSLADLMPGGGFIFGSTNSVQYGAKTDNYLKALELVREKGVYR